MKFMILKLQMFCAMIFYNSDTAWTEINKQCSFKINTTKIVLKTGFLLTFMLPSTVPLTNPEFNASCLDYLVQKLPKHHTT